LFEYLHFFKFFFLEVFDFFLSGVRLAFCRLGVRLRVVAARFGGGGAANMVG